MAALEERGLRRRTVASVALALADTAQAALVVLSSALIFGLVLTRYLLGYSDSSVEEIARYCAIWGTFLGLAVAHGRGFSIRFSLLEQLLPASASRILMTVVWFSCSAISFGLAYAGVELIAETRTLGEVMQTGLELPLWIPRASVAFGAAFLGLAYLASAFATILESESSASGHGGF